MLLKYILYIYFTIDFNQFFPFNSYISGHVVQTLPSLYELTLHNNPWNCDCKLRDLRDWMLQHNIPLSYSPNCSTPVRLSGQEWNALHLDDYACIPSIVSIDKQIVVNEGKCRMNFFSTHSSDRKPTIKCNSVLF